MNNPKNKTYLLPQNIRSFYLAILLALLLSLFTTACSSTCHRHESINRVLDKQNELLRKLEAERASAPIMKRLQADPTLSGAETHLQESLKALLDANATVKAAL